MLRKTVLFVSAMAMLLALVSGCAPAAEPTAVPAPKPTTAAQPTTPPEPGKTYQVALVCGLLGDRSFVDSAARGIEWAQERLANVETKIIENADVGEQQLAARAMAEAGYDLVVTMGFGAGDWTTEIANEYPDTQFALVDATLDIPNGTGLIFHEHTGCFTVGMVAALMSETGKIGYIGGMDVPLLRRFQEGYHQGALYANPNIQLVDGWVGGWSDPTKGKELALTQYEEGADIIFAAAGGSGEGVLAASAEVGLYSIGVDSDQCYIQPGAVMASMMKMVDVSVFDTIEELSKGGSIGGSNREYGLHNDAVGLCWLYDIDTYFADNAPADMVAKMPDVLAKVQAAVARIKAGEICVEDHMEVYPCDNPAQPGGMAGAPEVQTYQVALVCGLLGDRSFVDSAARGIEWAQERLFNVETKIIENADVGEQQLAARAMAEAGYDLVVTMGFGAGDWTTEIANEYPDTQFALVDATLDIPNGTGLIFHEHTGCFTVGMVAALMSETGKIGYIGGMDVPLLRRFQEGYHQGALYANPDIELVDGWVGGWSDPTKGKELALTQYEEGADIIFAAAGGSGEGVLAASAEVGLYSIGVDSDQCYIQPGAVMASMMKMVDVSVFDTIEELSKGGSIGGSNREYGLHNDAVGLCWLYDIDTYFADNAPADMVAKMPDVLAKVQAAVARIKAGEICVEDHMEVYPCDNPAQPGGMGN